MLVYLAETQDKFHEGSTWVIRKGNNVQSINGVDDFNFYPGESRFAYTVHSGKEVKLFMDVGNEVRCNSGEVFWWGGGRARLTYVEALPDGRNVLVDGVKRWPVKGSVKEVATNFVGNNTLWVVKDEKEERVLLNGREIAKGEEVAWIRLCGPEEAPWLAFKENNSWFLSYGGTRNGIFMKIGEPIDSGISGRAACFGIVEQKQGGKASYKTVLLVDGHDIAEVYGPDFQNADSSLPNKDLIHFTKDGKHVFCVLETKENREVLLVDGESVLEQKFILYAAKDITSRLHVALGAIASYYKKMGLSNLLQAIPEAEKVFRLALSASLADTMGLNEVTYHWWGKFNQNWVSGSKCGIGENGTLLIIGCDETETHFKLFRITVAL